ncbi:MAG: hypothetical protein KME28_15430 [Pelatocladus maniniholoensis HA4357-MV3]|jgi:hypothetical protein|uniref:Uncharacterized protein n=1 Tax=Pelatocladus maniniholoensis HA4357-MV3 TaxID=1117104 RepID=A0A9E3H8U1_9NOST|nr:hypothetical protein [Pelatocladus maniniholoensis HA4357-MV3]
MTTAVLEQSNLSSKETKETSTKTKLYKLDALVKATQKPIEEVKIMLARVRAAIYPREDGSELVAESHFDKVVLEWAKSNKQDLQQCNYGRADRKLTLGESPTSGLDDARNLI